MPATPSSVWTSTKANPLSEKTDREFELWNGCSMGPSEKRLTTTSVMRMSHPRSKYVHLRPRQRVRRANSVIFRAQSYNFGPRIAYSPAPPA